MISVFARLGKIYDLSKFIVYRKQITIGPVTILEPMKIDGLMKLVKCWVGVKIKKALPAHTLESQGAGEEKPR